MAYRGPTPEEGSGSWTRRIKPLGDPLLDDFRNFQYVCLKAVLGVKPTPLQYDVGEYLQYGPDFRIIMAFRGMSKSWMTAFFAPWLVLRNAVMTDWRPDINVLVASGTKDRAEMFTAFCRDLFSTVDALHPLIPKDPTRWSLSEFDVEGKAPAQVPTVASRAIFGRMTGDRGDAIIGDDLELPQNAETQGQRDKLHRRIGDFVPILKPGGEIVLLGTPHFEESIYNVLAEGQYDRRIWTARVPTPDKIPNYRGELAPYVMDMTDRPGAPVEPMRFDESELQIREAAGRSVFQMQYQLDTTLSDLDRYPLKLRDLMVCDLEYDVGPDRPIWSGSTEYTLPYAAVGLQGDAWQRPMGFSGPNGQPSFTPYDGVVLAIDPSGRGSNETAWSLVARTGSLLYLLEHGADVRGYDGEVLARILAVLKRADCHMVVYEENYGGGMFGSILGSYLQTHGWACTIEPFRSAGMKEARIIDALEPVFNSHRMVVASRCVENDKPGAGEQGHRARLWHQVTRMERIRGALNMDDRADALAIAVGYWTAAMRTDHAATMASRDQQDRREAVMGFWDELKPKGQGRQSQALKNAGFNYGIAKL